MALNVALDAALVGPRRVNAIGLATALTYSTTLVVFVYAFRTDSPRQTTPNPTDTHSRR